MSPARKRLFLAAGVALVAVAAAWGWTTQRGTPVDAVAVQAQPLVRTVQFSARVATLSRVEIGSTVTGRAEAVPVREGDAVRAGDLLVRLESDEARAALAQAEAAQRQAQARLAGLRGTGRQALRATQDQAEATLRQARAELERAQQLVAQGFVSASRLDEARRVLDVAQAQRDAAQAQVQANAEAGTDLVQADTQLQAAHAATQAARARLEQTLLRAPTNARVLTREVEPGQIVQPGKVLLRLALDGPTQLKAQVDERFLEQLAPGQPASVVADAHAGQPFAAQLLSLSPLVDAQRGAVEVKLALPQTPPAFLREDMTLSVEVETGRRERALVLPLSALQGSTPQGQAQVWVAESGRARLRTVALGLRTLEAAEVREGLAEGEPVLLATNLQEGQRVRPRLQPAQASALALWPRADRPSAATGGGAAGGALANAMGR